jgi:uncharacterized protein YqfA (UPF0365 family)
MPVKKRSKIIRIQLLMWRFILALSLLAFIQACGSETDNKANVNDSLKKLNSYSTDYEYVPQLEEPKSSTGTYLLIIVGVAAVIALIYYYGNDLRLKITSAQHKLGISFGEISSMSKINPGNANPFYRKLSELVVHEAIHAKRMNLDIEWPEIKQIATKNIDVNKYLQNIFVVKTREIGLTATELTNWYYRKNNIDNVFDLYVKLYDANTSIPMGMLCDLQSAGINLQEFVFAITFLKRANKPLNFTEFTPNYYKIVDLANIVMAYYEYVKAGFTDLPFEELQEHFLAKGNVKKVVEAVIMARQGKMDITFDDIANLDLAGFNVVEEVQHALKPQLIDVKVKAVSRDKFPVVVDVRVTFRANLRELIGNPQQETVLARLNEAIASAIGTVPTHKELFENPNNISQIVMSKGVDQGTALEIISMSVVKMDIGKCLEVEVRQEKARFERIIAEAESERRKMLAEASSREARAEIKRAEARIKKAEAQMKEAKAKATEKDLGVETTADVSDDNKEETFQTNE